MAEVHIREFAFKAPLVGSTLNVVPRAGVRRADSAGRAAGGHATRVSRRIIVVAKAMLALAFVPVACAPLDPSGGRVTQGQVGFEIQGGSLRLFQDHAPAFLRIRTFRVVDGATGPQEGGDIEFPIDLGGGTFTVSNVSLGLKEFQLAILNQPRELLGEGRATVLVRPGPQVAPAVTIAMNAAPRRRDLPLTLFVSVARPGEAKATTYQDVEPFVTAACAMCHGAVAPAGGLDLSAFPFVHQARSWTQEEIVREMIAWMRHPDPDLRMPPGAQAPAEDLVRLESWLSDGLPKFPRADEVEDLAQQIRITWRMQGSLETASLMAERAGPDQPFTAQCKDLVVRAKYDFVLEVLGEGGVLVHTDSVTGMELDGEGPMEYEIRIPYSEPQVTIPVVVRTALAR